ncbi:MAG: branched-chain amino acid transport system ATP-binding protein [Salinirussus sp.]|jgi:branched-chain amino acid transport system ATP-binding protein
MTVFDTPHVYELNVAMDGFGGGQCIANETDIDSVYIYYANYSFGQSVNQYYASVLENNGVPVEGRTALPPGYAEDWPGQFQKAVDGVGFELQEGELCSLIGPNGAGKTTFFNLLTGALEPTAGRIRFRDRDITDTSPERAASLGTHRSFQITNIFPTLTALENVRIATQAHSNASFALWRNYKTYEEFIEEAHGVLERVGLADRAEERAQNLSHGEERKLEVGIALVGDPDILLLDEPNAGVSSESVDEIIDLIRDISGDHAVLLVEHNTDIVMTVSDRVVVLNQGAVIADGPPETVQGDPRVQEAYLGGYEAGDAAGAREEANTMDEEGVA